MLYRLGANKIGCWLVDKCSILELLMVFQEVSFLPSRGSFSTTFLINCGKDESLRTTTCSKTVVAVSKSILHVKYFCSTKPFFVSQI